MTNFGLSSDEAFDFVAAGYQKGLNGSDDFLESINEYATQFSNGGADAGQFFSVLESGFQDGMLGTDKAADAFKEFRVRIQDGSTTTQAALDQLGLGEPFLNSLATGKITAVEAFDIVIQKLNETDDSSVVMQAGVGLIGTQFEDLGTKAALSLSTTQTKMADIAGTMSNFDTDTFSQKLASAWRTTVDSLASMDIWDGLKDQAGDAFEKIAANLETVFADYDFSALEGSAAEIWDTIAGYFEDAGFDLTTIDGMKNAVDLVVESIESLADVSEGVVDFFAPLASVAVSVIETFNSFDEDTKELVGNILGLGNDVKVYTYRNKLWIAYE
jgi:phage-related minor tail protein